MMCGRFRGDGGPNPRQGKRRFVNAKGFPSADDLEVFEEAMGRGLDLPR